MKNKIRFLKQDGKIDREEYIGSLVSFFHYIKPPPEVVEIETDKTLFVGDLVIYENTYFTEITSRNYCSTEDYFIFLGKTIYTGIEC